MVAGFGPKRPGHTGGGPKTAGAWQSARPQSPYERALKPLPPCVKNVAVSAPGCASASRVSGGRRFGEPDKGRDV
jgi:hypothetical protein